MGAVYHLNIRNDDKWPIFLTIGPWGDGYSSCITMYDGGPQLGSTSYIAAGSSLELVFYRSGDCSGEQGWLALRAAYNPFSTAEDGAWEQFWFDNDGGFSVGPDGSKRANYENKLEQEGELKWSLSGAADWPAGWSRDPLPNPIEFAYTSQFQKVWDDSGSGSCFDCSIYKPVRDGFWNLGYTTFGPDQILPDSEVAQRAALVARPLQPGVLVPPVRYDWIGDDHNSGASGDCSWWTPVPPDGFVALGTAFYSVHDTPPRDAIMCIRADLAAPAKGGKMVYADRGSGGSHDLEIFEIVPEGDGTIRAGASLAFPSYITGSPPKLGGAASVSACKPVGGDARPGALSLADVEAIIAASGPLLMLHPDETCMPISADKFVAAATLTKTEGGGFLTVTDQAILNGDLSSAEAYVFAQYVCEQFTDIQFWFFYGYNGATFIEVRIWGASGGVYLWSTSQDFDNLNCGQHTGDWENMTLRVDNRTRQVVALGYTSHGDTEWYAYSGGQPRSYSALHMHGSCPTAGTHYELASWTDKDISVAHLEIMIYSRNICADGGQSLDCSRRYRIVGSNFLPDIQMPAWLTGDYANLDWGPTVHHEDKVTVSLPAGIPYTYDYSTDDSGPSTPVFRVS